MLAFTPWELCSLDVDNLRAMVCHTPTLASTGPLAQTVLPPSALKRGADCAEKDGNKHLLLNTDRAKYWLALGAQPSDTVARIFGQVGVLPALPFPPKVPLATKNPDKWRWTKAAAAATADKS